MEQLKLLNHSDIHISVQSTYYSLFVFSIELGSIDERDSTPTKRSDAMEIDTEASVEPLSNEAMSVDDSQIAWHGTFLVTNAFPNYGLHLAIMSKCLQLAEKMSFKFYGVSTFSPFPLVFLIDAEDLGSADKCGAAQASKFNNNEPSSDDMVSVEDQLAWHGNTNHFYIKKIFGILWCFQFFVSQLTPIDAEDFYSTDKCIAQPTNGPDAMLMDTEDIEPTTETVDEKTSHGRIFIHLHFQIEYLCIRYNGFYIITGCHRVHNTVK